MAKVVYMLGAGFNCSVLMPAARRSAPLARNFFQVLLRSRRDRWLDGFRGRPFVDTLFEEIERYWKLDRAALGTKPFDIEECLTFFESKLTDQLPAGDAPTISNAAFGLRYLLLMYLGELNMEPVITPAAGRFGETVLSERADVLTSNYDGLADSAIELASLSLISTGPPPPLSLRRGVAVAIPDDYLSASHFAWNRNLAYGTTFAEVPIPVAGIPEYVSGKRYYSHPSNALYKDTRVLKLHGSIDWLRHTKRRSIPPEIDSGHEAIPPEGIVLSRNPSYWRGELPQRNGWYMDPEIITPQLYKQYNGSPYPELWQAALDTLSECEKLIVIGYSFPPTDFRTRRLFLEAFSDRKLDSLTVVNPDRSVADVVCNLTHYKGPVVTCDNLQSLYGVPPSHFPVGSR